MIEVANAINGYQMLVLYVLKQFRHNFTDKNAANVNLTMSETITCNILDDKCQF